MHPIPQIDVQQARRLLEEEDALFVDIRDPVSHSAGRIPGSLHLDDRNVEDFVTNTDKSRHVVVYCYHGNSSIAGTQYLQTRGFENVSSLAGGFEAWQMIHSDQIVGDQV